MKIPVVFIGCVLASAQTLCAETPDRLPPIRSLLGAAFAEMGPASVPEREMLTGAARSVARLIQPRALSGTETLTLESCRETIRQTGDIDSSYQTAQQVLADVALAGRELGLPGEAVAGSVGWAVLWRNWGFATILGESSRAVGYATEAYDLEAAAESGGSSDSLLPPHFTSAEIDQLAMALSLQLRFVARQIGDDAAVLPNVCDPEGYVRQRLRFVYLELLSDADWIQGLRRN